MPRNNQDTPDVFCYIEIIPMGRYVKVSAIDPKSGLEVSIRGDAKAPSQYLSQLASKKLAQRLLALAEKNTYS